MQVPGEGLLQAEKRATAITLRWGHSGVFKEACEGQCGESTEGAKKKNWQEVKLEVTCFIVSDLYRLRPHRSGQNCGYVKQNRSSRM